jgi:hypothetical protein
LKSGTALKKRRNGLEQGDLEYPGNLECVIAKVVFPSRRLASKVVYNLAPEDEFVVVTIQHGKPPEVNPDETRV